MNLKILVNSERDCSEIFYSFSESRFGLCLIASNFGGDICNVLFGNSRDELVAELNLRWKNAELVFSPKDEHHIVATIIEGKTFSKDVNLLLSGSEFQIDVWKELLKIEEGELLNYGEIANRLGGKNYSRAVGRAVALNPIAYLIPCHRVIKSSGEISGYHWGVERKRQMLKTEGSYGKLVGEME